MRRIGIVSENSLEYIECILAIWRAGASAVLIDRRMPIKHIVDNTN